MRIVFVGRMAADKGIFDLIDILARLRNPKAYIDAIGPISPLAERRLMAFAHKMGVAGRFNILGAQKNTDLPKLLCSAGVFLFPSTHAEGLSKAVMEAMAASLPVVAYQIQGMDALVKHSQTGWLLPPSDTVAAAQKLDVMLDQPAVAQRMGAAGRHLLETDFTRAAEMAQWQALFDRLAPRAAG